ncbi:MAG: hypothetical protein JW891_05955 [Candidatus Lokiarchaeota archaeon]|nr:hypothetical protein [Candidatus Lokiarchaeota archaeon]
MKIRYGAMIFWGVLKAIFYLVLPLVLIGVLESYNIMQVSIEFKVVLIVLGIIGTVLAVITHMFEKNTPAHGYTKIIDSAYSAIFLVFVFGGFTPGLPFGTFVVTYEGIVASVRIQIFAYLFLIGALLSLARHIVRTIELSKDKKYHITIKRKFQASRVFQVAGIVTSIIILAYFISIPASAVNVRIGLLDELEFEFAYDDGGTNDTVADDSLRMYIPFYVSNYGVYSILNVRINIGIIVYNCTHVDLNGTDTHIADGTRIGGTPLDIWEFRQNTYTTQNFTLSIESTHLVDLVLNNASLVVDVSFGAKYAGIEASVDLGNKLIPPIEWQNQTWIPSLP